VVRQSRRWTSQATTSSRLFLKTDLNSALNAAMEELPDNPHLGADARR